MYNGKDKRAPMASAPMQYRDNGEVAWGEMWGSFCALALEGGPPHRGEMLVAQPVPDTHSPTYQLAVQEIVRGIREVSGLPATEVRPGWIGVTCPSPAMAGCWLRRLCPKTSKPTPKPISSWCQLVIITPSRERSRMT